MADYVRNYDKLVEMLPNARHTAGVPMIHDSVVVGPVAAIADGVGVIDTQIPAQGDVVRFRNNKVSFISPLAHWRTLKVTWT